MLSQFEVKIFVVLFVTTSVMNLANTKSSWVYKNDVESKICFNPNNNLGHCVPIKECNAFKYVIKNKLQSHYKFFWASQCQRETGDPPFVCCNHDIQFRFKDRIVFPDELEKFKESKGIEPIESIPTTTTERTVLQKVESTSTPNSASEEITSSRNLFPKPPNCGAIVVANKIYGGQNAELTEFSWVVILEYRNQTTGKLLMDCAGSLINDRYVLTAAHCLRGNIIQTNGKLESVRVGDHNTDTDIDCDDASRCGQPFQRIAVESIIPHENFSLKSNIGTRNQHDIGLLRLKKAVKSNENLQPVCLPNVLPFGELEESTKFVVSGWGHNGTMVRTAIKQKLELPLVSHEKCRKSYGKKFYLADEQICAGGLFRQDSCNGDSGGPLMRLHNDFWVLEGLVSFGLKCGLEQPGIYTNVRHYIQWIKENIQME